MNNLFDKIKQYLGIVPGLPLSPLPQSSTINTPELRDYVARDAAGTSSGVSTASAQPQRLDYPAWMSNAPAKGTSNPVAPPMAAQYQQGVQPTIQPQSNLEAMIKQGLGKYGNVPVATLSAELAQAGQQLPDPYLPAILSLIETAGGNKVTRGANNWWNLLPGGKSTNYADPRVALLGGGDKGQKGLIGILKSGAYDKYLKSGDLKDFFSVYSPSSENAAIPDQIARYNSIKNQYFSPTIAMGR